MQIQIIEFALCREAIPSRITGSRMHHKRALLGWRRGPFLRHKKCASKGKGAANSGMGNLVRTFSSI